MGIRTNQVFGLTERARELLDGEGLLPVENGETFEGYFDEKYPLHNWVPLAGELARADAEVQRLELSLAAARDRRDALARTVDPVYVEYVQEIVYSSGPCFFLALRDVETGEPVQATLWPQGEIDAA